MENPSDVLYPLQRSCQRRRRELHKMVNFNPLRRDDWVAQIALRLPPKSRILDIGAGPCRYRHLFTHCDYNAHDFAQYDGTNAGDPDTDWSYGKLDYVSDAADIPTEAQSFDAVLCTEVLEHVPEPILVLKEIGRILRPGGFVFLSTPLASWLHQQPYHFYGGFTPYFYRRFLPQAGLEIVDIQANGHFFRMILQEIYRGAHYIRKHYPGWHPYRFLSRIAANYWAAKWLTYLDEEIPLPAFTVGYFVEARKTP